MNPDELVRATSSVILYKSVLAPSKGSAKPYSAMYCIGLRDAEQTPGYVTHELFERPASLQFLE